MLFFYQILKSIFLRSFIYISLYSVLKSLGKMWLFPMSLKVWRLHKTMKKVQWKKSGKHIPLFFALLFSFHCHFSIVKHNLDLFCGITYLALISWHYQHTPCSTGIWWVQMLSRNQGLEKRWGIHNHCLLCLSCSSEHCCTRCIINTTYAGELNTCAVFLYCTYRNIYEVFTFTVF